MGIDKKHILCIFRIHNWVLNRNFLIPKGEFIDSTCRNVSLYICKRCGKLKIGKVK
jgi:hypothetical protein